MAREAWEEVSFQVFTDEDGVLRSGYYPTGNGVVNGNVAVDFVWGNFPLQPNDDREGGNVLIPQVEDYGWTQARKINSGNLNAALGNHSIATTGYSNFPKFIPDYEGDGDTGFETVVPNLVGVNQSDVAAVMSAANLDWSFDTVVPAISSAVAAGDTVTVTVNDTYNLRVGDNIYVANLEVGGTPYGAGSVVLTAVTPTTISWANAGEWEFDDTATGDVLGISTYVRVFSQDIEAGDVVDEGTVVTLGVILID